MYVSPKYGDLNNYTISIRQILLVRYDKDMTNDGKVNNAKHLCKWSAHTVSYHILNGEHQFFILVCFQVLRRTTTYVGKVETCKRSTVVEAVFMVQVSDRKKTTLRFGLFKIWTNKSDSLYSSTGAGWKDLQ